MEARFAHQLLRSLLLTLLFYVTGNCQKLCFYPNGSRANDIPCNPNASDSVCCGPGYKCLANGVCAATAASINNGGITFIRGSCTDEFWQSSLCPQFCLNADDNNLAGGNAMNTCSTANVWCCDSNQVGCICNVTLSSDTTAYTTIGEVESSTSTSSSSSSSTSTSATAQSSTSSADIQSSTSSASSSSTGSGSASFSATASPAANGGGLSTGAKIGLGVGIPIGVILLGIIAWLVWNSRRQNERLNNMKMREIQEALSGDPTRYPDTVSNRYLGPSNVYEMHRTPPQQKQAYELSQESR